MIILNKKKLSKAVDYLQAGKTIVFPTETSYGLGCDATNQAAVDKIFKIKEREKNKPLLVIVSSIEMAKLYLQWNKIIDKLAIKYWPGSLTIVGRPVMNLTDGVISSDNTLAARVTNNPIAKFLSEKLGRPIVATSANISGQSDIYDSAEIKKLYDHKKNIPDCLLDFGIIHKRKPTTIVSVINGIKILRQGEIEINF